MHRVPEDFRLLTKISLQVLYQLWYEGVHSRRIGPFKHFDSHDVHKDDRRHLTTAKALIAEIEKFLPDGFRDLSSSDRDSNFKTAFDAMAISFLANEAEGAPKRKAVEDCAYTTLYTKFYLPSKKRRATVVP